MSLLLIILRKVCHLQAYITRQHIALMNTVMLIAGSLVAVAYLTEIYTAWRSDNAAEQFVFLNRATGPYAWAFALMLLCNVLLPQLLWVKRLRHSIAFTVFVSIVICVGMWFERFVIIVTSLHRDYLPSSWTIFSPTYVDVGVFVGTIGLFLVLFLLYARTFPMIAQAEIKQNVLLDSKQPEGTRTAEELVAEVKALRAQGVAIKEVYTPFAVHGLSEALGLKPSRLGKATFVYGLLGFLFGAWLVYYTMIADWPQNFGGKPNATLWQGLPAFVPVIFELTVYFAAHLLVLSFLFRSRLYPTKKAENPKPESTDDTFVIAYESAPQEDKNEK